MILTGKDIDNIIAGLSAWIEWEPMDEEGNERAEDMRQLIEKITRATDEDENSKYRLSRIKRS